MHSRDVSSPYIPEPVTPLPEGLVAEPLRLVDGRDLVHPPHHRLQHAQQLSNDLGVEPMVTNYDYTYT